MAKRSEKNDHSSSSATHAEQSAGSGTRHVGKTLESDPEYNEQPGRELAPQRGLIDPHGNDITASPDMRTASQRVEEELTRAGGHTEELKTRLPGDTSSDPHTDLGKDNATTVAHRGERKKR